MIYWNLPDHNISNNLVILMFQRYLAQGGVAVWHYWSNLPGELGGWRPNQDELTPITYKECLEILTKLVPDGYIVIKSIDKPVLIPGIKPQASEAPGESSCSGSFCEIADRYDKGGIIK